jgi:hypothetical protein
MASSNRCILTPEEFTFMNAHHEEIEQGLIAAKCGDDTPIDLFINSEDYQNYTPRYDWTLRSVLHQKLKEDVENGHVTLR